MQPKHRVVAATLAAVGLVAATMPSASARDRQPKYKPPVVKWVAPIVEAQTDDMTAIVRATYRCFGGNSHTHLYIGVKQGPDINATNHTSSQYAVTFYSTNWNSDGPGLRVNCNGEWHTKSFLLKPDPYWAHANTAPPLQDGPAFVQFCVFDSTNTGENDPNGFGFNYSMKRVDADDNDGPQSQQFH